MPDSDLVLFSTLAVQGPLQRDVLPMLAKGFGIRAVFDPTSVLLGRIAGGEHADVIIALTADVEALRLRNVVGPVTAVARTGVGIGVDATASRPDVSSVPRLKDTLRTARSVAYSRSGASGRYFAGLLDRLGIADEVNARATIVEKGFTGHAVLDGRADVAVQQISELRFVDGVALAGPLPAEVQYHSEFSAACFHDGDHAAALVRALTTAEACAAYRHWGLDCGQ